MYTQPNQQHLNFPGYSLAGAYLPVVTNLKNQRYEVLATLCDKTWADTF